MLKFNYNDEKINLEVRTKFNEEASVGIVNIIKAIKGEVVAAGAENLLESLLDSNESKISETESINNVDRNVDRSVDRSIDRERLPNNIEEIENGVLIGDAPLQADKVTAHRNFMCGKCHQSMSIMINDDLIIKDIEAEKSILHIMESNFKPRSNKEILEYGETLGEYVQESDVVVCASDSLYGTCINCNHSDTTKKWVENYSNKILLTGYDETCPLCGSEMVYNSSDDNTSYICDNEECKYVKKTNI